MFQNNIFNTAAIRHRFPNDATKLITYLKKQTQNNTFNRTVS